MVYFTVPSPTSSTCTLLSVSLSVVYAARKTLLTDGSSTIDSIVKGLETGLINTFPADSPRCAVDNILDSFHGCF